jgi:4,5-dihydroxyphthalate decarboxylase
MKKTAVNIALERYERHMPFFMGTVALPENLELTPLEVSVGLMPGRRDGMDRHGRMFRDQAFDICEQSLSSYIMAKSRDMPFSATPVFPRRLFSQNQLFVNVDARIHTPRDLIGKNVGVWSFQNTLCVLLKGDLRHEYGVPWSEIRWYSQNEELIPWEPRPELSIRSISGDKGLGQMLIDGDLDAILHPEPPPEILARTDRVRRLFSDPRAESKSYFDKNGFFPIMHVMSFRQDVVERAPWLPLAMIDIWEDAKAQADAYYDDPAFLQLAFGRGEYELQRETMGKDLFPSGLSANRRFLERFIDDMVDQELIDGAMNVEALFHESTWQT